MAYQIIYSPRSLADLDEIVDYIADDNPQAAARFRETLIDLVDELRDFPEMGGTYSKYSNVRRLVHNPAAIYYRIRRRRKIVDIVHIRHSKRKPPPF